MENLKKLGESLSKLFSEHLSYVAVAVITIAGIFLVAFLAQKLLRFKQEVQPVRRLTIMALLCAVAIILNLFSFPIPFIAPSFYKLDFSEMPILICGFLLGPVAGVMAELVKILLNILINGTGTMFIGEFANFVMGCALVLPASIVYISVKSKKGALIGVVAGSVIMVVIGCVLNAQLLLPWYAENFFAKAGGMDAIINAGNEVHSVIDSAFTFVIFAVAPFNLIKAVGVSVITFILYKRLSKVLKTAR